MARRRKGLFQFEHRGDKLASSAVFAGRVVWGLLVAGLVICFSLVAGMAGYVATEGMNTIDAFANAAMILSGMGPLSPLTTDAGKIFAGLYAIYSGLVLVLVSGIILAPVAHRLLHSLHVPEED